MRRAILVAILGIPVLCVGGVIVFLLIARSKAPDIIDGAVAAPITEEVARSIKSSVLRRISPDGLGGTGVQQPAETMLVLHSADLDVNTIARFAEAGITTGNDGTVIYGVVTAIDREGISLSLAGNRILSGVPAVVDGRVVLTEIEGVPRDPDGSDGANWLTDALFSPTAFASGITQGINGALATRRLTPVSLALASGSMTIRLRRQAGPREGTPAARSVVQGRAPTAAASPRLATALRLAATFAPGSATPRFHHASHTALSLLEGNAMILRFSKSMTIPAAAIGAVR